MYANPPEASDWPKTLIWAFFDTPTGASEALRTLRDASSAHLMTVENTAIVVKDAAGNITFDERADLGGGEGLAAGLLIGGLLGAVFPGASALTTGAAVGLGSHLRDAGFADEQLTSAADRMPVNSSALFAVGTREWVEYMDKHRWLDDLLGYLNQMAYKVGWVPISEQLAGIAAERGAAR
jgi:uncharacterized membrane protein